MNALNAKLIETFKSGILESPAQLLIFLKSLEKSMNRNIPISLKESEIELMVTNLGIKSKIMLGSRNYERAEEILTLLYLLKKDKKVLQ